MKRLFLALALVLSTAVGAQVLDDSAVNLKFTGRLNLAKATSINSNSVVDLNAANGNLVHIVGTTTITSFGVPSQAGIHRTVIFDGAVVLTYNAATLSIPGNTTITTAAGDTATVVSDSLTKWTIVHYTRRATAL